MLTHSASGSDERGSMENESRVVPTSIRLRLYWPFHPHLPNVSLTDEDASMVDGLGEPQFEDLGLESPLQEVFHLQAQDVIELHLALIQHTDPHQTSKQGVA